MSENYGYPEKSGDDDFPYEIALLGGASDSDVLAAPGPEVATGMELAWNLHGFILLKHLN